MPRYFVIVLALVGLMTAAGLGSTFRVTGRIDGSGNIADGQAVYDSGGPRQLTYLFSTVRTP